MLTVKNLSCIFSFLDLYLPKSQHTRSKNVKPLTFFLLSFETSSRSKRREETLIIFLLCKLRAGVKSDRHETRGPKK